MKTLKLLIIAGLTVIGFNLIAAIYSSMNGAYDPMFAENMAKMGITVVFLIGVYLIIWLIKLLMTRRE
jgi:hypothetical protein